MISKLNLKIIFTILFFIAAYKVFWSRFIENTTIWLFKDQISIGIAKLKRYFSILFAGHYSVAGCRPEVLLCRKKSLVSTNEQNIQSMMGVFGLYPPLTNKNFWDIFFENCTWKKV